MAENFAKYVPSRAGYRAHLTQTFKKASSIIQKESLTDSDIASLNRIKEQLARKKTILQKLDQKIAAAIEEPKEIEKEIFETEDILEQIEEAAAQISQSINNLYQLSHPKSTLPMNLSKLSHKVQIYKLH